jgi:hypothetical protein
MKAEFAQLHDFVCTQTVDRYNRASADKRWDKIDTLQFDTAFVGDRELYALAGSQRFDSRPLAAFIARGAISNGQLALLARDVFVTSTASFTYRGETEQTGRPVYEFGYDVPASDSSYHLRVGSTDAVTAFQGVFWIDRETLDLIRLEVQAYDIPDSLGLAEADTALDYSRVNIDGIDALLPRAAALTVVATDGGGNMNRTRFSAWRHYRAESTIRFANTDAAPASTGDADRTMPAPPPFFPRGAVIELALDSGLDPASAKLGDVITATLERPLGDTLSRGASITGRVVLLEKTTMPFPIYQVGLQFDAVSLAGRTIPLSATMQDAGPASGLVHRSKHLDPTFTRKRTASVEILVPEIHRGQGILEWDARKGAIPRGLKMRWRVDAPDQATTALHP